MKSREVKPTPPAVHKLYEAASELEQMAQEACDQRDVAAVVYYATEARKIANLAGMIQRNVDRS